MPINATTTAMLMTFDPSNYVQVSGDVMFNGAKFTGAGKVEVSPVLVMAGHPNLPLVGPLGNFYSKELAFDLASKSFDFRLQKNQMYMFYLLPAIQQIRIDNRVHYQPVLLLLHH